MKKKIFIDFDLFINNLSKNDNDYLALEPKLENFDLLKALNVYYAVYVFTNLEREKVYKWFILHYLHCHIADVVNIRDTDSLYLNKKTLKQEADFID